MGNLATSRRQDMSDSIVRLSASLGVESNLLMWFNLLTTWT